ncbi:major facilitator superfamily domain-containing protein [Phyllosticta citricarpa]|uniref:Major facilitator superfamily domain-containing protein n=1 Tax=Phyllosticta paracitricarpa TaxID=2016321 RepID=A0ABR1N246_9PEZI
MTQGDPDRENGSSERTPLLQSSSNGGDTEPDLESQQHRQHLKRYATANVRNVPTEDESLLGAQAQDEPQDAPPYRGGVTVTQFWFIFVGLCLLYFVACFDSTLMASSHPVITSYFHSSNSASWLSTAFLLTSTSFQPLMARASDTAGRRPVFVTIMVLFAGTTLACALAPTMGAFIAARAFAGLGAGGVFAMGSILTNDLVPVEIRGHYQALINLFFGLGQACGAAFGGLMCDVIGWRWTFGVQIPLQLVVLLIAVVWLPSNLGPCIAATSDKRWWQHLKNFDLGGSFLLACTVAAMILGLNLGGNVLPWTHPFIPASFAVSLLSGALLLWVESRAPLPVLPLSTLFTSPRGPLVFSNFFSNMASNAVIFNAPLYFQAVKLDSPSASGLRMAAPSVAVMVAGVSSGFLVTATRRLKPLITCGSLIALLGAIALTAMWHGIPTALATAFIVPTGAGQGLIFPATSLAVIATSPDAEQAVMTASLSLFRSLGSVFGVAVSSLLVQNVLGRLLDAGVQEPNKDDVIRQVKRSVRAIFDLDDAHRAQVIRAYEGSLRWAFASAVVLFFLVNVCVWPIRLPRLGEAKKKRART